MTWNKIFPDDRPYANQKTSSPEHTSHSAAASPVISEETQAHSRAEEKQPEN